MSKRYISLNESDIKNIVESSLRRILIETYEESEADDWYEEEDYDGKTGKPGQVRSYYIGNNDISNWEKEAEEEGYDNVGEYIKYWFDEVSMDLPWYWETLGKGYGYHGDTLYEKDGLVIKDIYGLVMIDEYGPDKK